MFKPNRLMPIPQFMINPKSESCEEEVVVEVDPHIVHHIQAKKQQEDPTRVRTHISTRRQEEHTSLYTSIIDLSVTITPWATIPLCT